MNPGPSEYLNTLAYSDVLAISARLQRRLDDVAPSEVHLFAYLACLLSLYYGWPASSWGYAFATTEDGYPYSANIDEALKQLSQAGAITNDLSFFAVTERGQQELNFTMSLRQHARRRLFIEGACASALALPVGFVRHALLGEPDLQLAVGVRRSRKLLGEIGLDLLHEHFEALNDAVGPVADDASVPAFVWLNYLAEVRSVEFVEENRQ